MSYIQRGRSEELNQGQDEVHILFADSPRGFRLRVDLNLRETLGSDCLSEIGRLRELFNRKGVGVISGPGKDIRLGILTLFRCPPHSPIVTRQTLTEAVKLLELRIYPQGTRQPCHYQERQTRHPPASQTRIVKIKLAKTGL